MNSYDELDQNYQKLKSAFSMLAMFVNELAENSEPEPDWEDFVVGDYTGGNVDDAYSLGRTHERASVGSEAVLVLNYIKKDYGVW